MVIRFLLIFLFLLTGIHTPQAQEKAVKKIMVTGTITDSENKPVNGAHIYVDSVKTKVKTNKKGYYKIKLHSKTKLLTVFSVNHGMLNFNYNGEQNLNFMFSKNNAIMTERELAQLGYKASGKKGNNQDKKEGYDNYRDIFELLRARFPNVRVVRETITIRAAGTSLTGNNTPLFIVNGSEVSSIASIAPIDIKSIVVIKGTSTSLYGARGANGVIKIKLKY